MKVTLDQKNYALLVLQTCFDSVRETCDECEGTLAGAAFCGCGVNGGDLVDAVGEEIANLRAEIEAAQKK